jgi:hypothetical protein
VDRAAGLIQIGGNESLRWCNPGGVTMDELPTRLPSTQSLKSCQRHADDTFHNFDNFNNGRPGGPMVGAFIQGSGTDGNFYGLTVEGEGAGGSILIANGKRKSAGQSQWSSKDRKPSSDDFPLACTSRWNITPFSNRYCRPSRIRM